MSGKTILVATIIMLCGCNTTLFVSTDNVISKARGYMIIPAYGQEVEFLPSMIDTSLSLFENLTKHPPKRGFYLFGMYQNTLSYLKMFGDTLYGLSTIVPVTLEYRRVKEVNTRLRKQEEIIDRHFLILGEERYIYTTDRRAVYYINAVPLLSAEKKEEKTRILGVWED